METVNAEEIEYNDEDIKAQEKINLRREARRRKILENAKNRLERLNGKTGSTNTSSMPTNNYEYPATNCHKPWLEHIDYDNARFSDPEVEPDIAPQQMVESEPPLGFGNLLSTLNTETTSTTQKRHFIIRARLHLIISALVSCILTLIFAKSTISSYSIFIPAGLCVVIDLLFFREQQPINPMITAAIALCNVRLPAQTNNILHVFAIIQSLVVDLGVFIFSFCIFSCGFVYLNNSLIDFIVIK